MRLIDRYLLRELLIPLGYCLGGFLIFLIAFSLFSELNKFQENHLVFLDVAQLYAIRLPGDLVLILPIALLCALLYTLTNHARHHELTAIRAAGIGLWRICLPYLTVGLLLSLGVFYMNEHWVPDTADREQRIMDRHKPAPVGVFPPNIVAPFVFNNSRDGHKWVCETYDLDTHVMTKPQVIWSRKDGDVWISAERAEPVDDVWTFFGSSTFTALDITNFPALALRLMLPSGDPVSTWLNPRLSPATQALLSVYKGDTNEHLKASLLEDLNRIARSGPIYETERFAGVKLSPEATRMLEDNPQGADLSWLNRQLLLDAFPGKMSKIPSYTIRENLAKDRGSVPILFTNLLAMPEFTETPEQMKREILFRNRLGNKSIESTEVPISDLKDYLSLNPDMNQKNRWWVETQIQGRLAAPWTCLVVVLIAIPFGAASGRRNIFVGVASSIAICFAYFILLRLGLALGTGGYLPAYAAAWLPNFCFSLAGLWLMLRVR